MAAPEGFVANLQKPVSKFEVDKAGCDRLVALVERSLELSKTKHSGTLAPSE